MLAEAQTSAEVSPESHQGGDPPGGTIAPLVGTPPEGPPASLGLLGWAAPSPKQSRSTWAAR